MLDNILTGVIDVYAIIGFIIIVFLGCGILMEEITKRPLVLRGHIIRVGGIGNYFRNNLLYPLIYVVSFYSLISLWCFLAFLNNKSMLGNLGLGIFMAFMAILSSSSLLWKAIPRLINHRIGNNFLVMFNIILLFGATYLGAWSLSLTYIMGASYIACIAIYLGSPEMFIKRREWWLPRYEDVNPPDETFS